MAFRSRGEYETWRAGRGSDARTEPGESRTSEPGEIELRVSPLYGILVLFLGVVFAALALMPWNKGGPTFRTFCLVLGAAALAGGVVLLRNRSVIVRMTSRALELREAVIPWTEISAVEREYIRRNFWINVHLKTKRTDLDAAALKARAALRALGQSADFDYTILEADLPRSGVWFVEECRRRIAAAETNR